MIWRQGYQRAEFSERNVSREIGLHEVTDTPYLPRGESASASALSFENQITMTREQVSCQLQAQRFHEQARGRSFLNHELCGAAGEFVNDQIAPVHGIQDLQRCRLGARREIIELQLD